MGLKIPHEEPCPFCDYLSGLRPCAFVACEDTASAFVNPTQYERGGLLVVPNQHVSTILDASSSDVADVARLAQTLCRALDLAFDLTGLNVFQNNGQTSGQQVPHYHVHIVPRHGPPETMKLFRAEGFPFLSVEQLEPVAVEIREALADLRSRAT